jgi:hypothetical protein
VHRSAGCCPDQVCCFARGQCGRTGGGSRGDAVSVDEAVRHAIILTNARKHARHAAVTVELSGRPESGLDLCVRNPVRVGGDHRGNDSIGFGLIGLAERAAASHGRLAHGLTPEGDFLLRAWLPWDR